MFTKAILSTTLTSEAADRLFSNITASYAPDKSFLSTLRALLRKRLPQGESVQVNCRNIRITENEVIAASVSQCMGWFVPQGVQLQTTTGYNIFIQYAANPEVGNKMLDIVRSNAGENKRHLRDYKRRDDLRVFFMRKVNALFYTSADERSTIIFTDKLELKHFHALQMMIPKYLPKLFAGGLRGVGDQLVNGNLNPLTEPESTLLKSLGNKYAVDYETLIEEFAKEIDLRSEIIRTKLAGFETAFERIRVTELKDEIAAQQSNYDYHLSVLRDLSNEIQERQYTLSGLVCSIEHQAGDSELMEYFMCNKNLSIINVSGTSIQFVVHGYADIYDQEAFDKYVCNHGGYLYSNINTAISKVQMEKLLRAIFSENGYNASIGRADINDRYDGQNGSGVGNARSDGNNSNHNAQNGRGNNCNAQNHNSNLIAQNRHSNNAYVNHKYKLRICAAYTADIRVGLKARKQYLFTPESNTYLPNPHIQHHGCIGTYAARFQEYMQKRDYVGAIDQAAVSARNLNFYDSAVMGTFARELSYSSQKCLEKPDGTLVTPLDAIGEMEAIPVDSGQCE